MSEITTGGTGIGSRKLPIPCGNALSDKFKFNKEILLESGQIGNVVAYSRPVGDVNQNPLTFNIEPLADTFLSLDDIYFWIQCKILKANGENVDANDKFGIISSFGLSFFQNLKILLNGFELSPSSENDMPYKNYVETLLSYDVTNQNNYLSPSILELDDINHLECTTPIPTDENNKPNAFINRYNRVKDSKSFDITVPLCCDFFRSDSHLPPANRITIVATRASSEFLIQSETAEQNGGYIIKVEDIKLCYNRIRLDPTLTAKILGKPCQYLTVQTHVKKYALPSGITTYSTELYNGVSFSKFSILFDKIY